jgi:flagellar basal body rod protein FlgG
VNAIQAETDLIGLQRHFDLLERALQIINSDFDQAATSELPRLS